MKYKRKGSLLACDVLHALMDGKIHTQRNIADRIEVSVRSVSRGLEQIRYKYIVHSSHLGVWLDPTHIYYGLKKLN